MISEGCFVDGERDLTDEHLMLSVEVESFSNCNARDEL